MVRYDYEELEEVDEEEYSGLSEEELLILVNDLSQERQKEGVEIEIIEQNLDNEGNYLKFRVTKKNCQFTIKNVPTENFLISRNAKSKEDAELVGDRDWETGSSFWWHGT